MSPLHRTLLALPLAALFLASCASNSAQRFDVQEGAAKSWEAMAPYHPATAICVLHGTTGNERVQGTIRFTNVKGGVRVEASIDGLTPGKHGMHVHEFGDVDCGDGKCTGGHFNPAGVDHGGPQAAVRHVGDLGNVVADDEGHAALDYIDDRISLDFAKRACVVGRAIIVHSDADDLTSQPTGNAGGRVAAGVIGVGKE